MLTVSAIPEVRGDMCAVTTLVAFYEYDLVADWRWRFHASNDERRFKLQSMQESSSASTVCGSEESRV